MRSIVAAVLLKDSVGFDLLDQLTAALAPLDTDGDGIVTQAELGGAAEIQLSPSWDSFLAAYGGTLHRYLAIGELIGWRLR